MFGTTAYRESCRRIPETCPTVDKIMKGLADQVREYTESEVSDLVGDATDAVKKVTTSLRDALVEALEEMHSLEDKVKDLQAEISDHMSTISGLEDEVNSLRQELQEIDPSS